MALELGDGERRYRNVFQKRTMERGGIRRDSEEENLCIKGDKARILRTSKRDGGTKDREGLDPISAGRGTER